MREFADHTFCVTEDQVENDDACTDPTGLMAMSDEMSDLQNCVSAFLRYCIKAVFTLERRYRNEHHRALASNDPTRRRRGDG